MELETALLKSPLSGGNTFQRKICKCSISAHHRVCVGSPARWPHSRPCTQHAEQQLPGTALPTPHPEKACDLWIHPWRVFKAPPCSSPSVVFAFSRDHLEVANALLIKPELLIGPDLTYCIRRETHYQGSKHTYHHPLVIVVPDAPLPFPGAQDALGGCFKVGHLASAQNQLHCAHLGCR